MKISASWKYREDQHRNSKRSRRAISKLQKWHRDNKKNSAASTIQKWYRETQAQRILAKSVDKNNDMVFLDYICWKQEKDLELSCGMPNMSITPDIPNVMECSFAGGTGMNITQTYINVASSLLLLGSFVSITADSSSRITTRGRNYRRPSHHLLMLLVMLVNLGSAEAASSRGSSFNLQSIMASLGCLFTYMTLKELCNIRGKAATHHPIMQACNIMYPIIHTTLSEFSPDALLKRGEFKKLNKGVSRRIWDNGKKKAVQNPAFRSNTIGTGKKRRLILNKIAREAWNDPQVKAQLLKVKVKKGDWIGHTVEGDGTLIKNQRDIYKLLIVPIKGASNPKTSTYFMKFVGDVIRKKSRTVPLEQARENAEEGYGIFSGLPDDKADDYEEKLVALLNDGPEDGYMSRQEADSCIVQMLEQDDMQYLWFLSIHQLTHLALQHVMFHSDLRREDVREDIEAHAVDRDIATVDDLPDDTWDDKDISSFSGKLHDQELNELALMIEYMIKVKGKLIAARDMLMDRRALFLDLSDDYEDDDNDEDERIVPFDVVIPVSHLCIIYVYHFLIMCVITLYEINITYRFYLMARRN